MKDARIKWLKTPLSRIKGRKLNLLSLVGDYYISTASGRTDSNGKLMPINCFGINFHSGNVFETYIYKVNLKTFFTPSTTDDWDLLDVYSTPDSDVRKAAKRHIEICREIADGVYCFDNSGTG
jgi:hypothetical protein